LAVRHEHASLSEIEGRCAHPTEVERIQRGIHLLTKKRRASAGQKEMLMPIEGKKASKEGATKKPASKPQRKSA
jgi:hypothetical protein